MLKDRIEVGVEVLVELMDGSKEETEGSSFEELNLVELKVAVLRNLLSVMDFGFGNCRLTQSNCESPSEVILIGRVRSVKVRKKKHPVRSISLSSGLNVLNALLII